MTETRPSVDSDGPAGMSVDALPEVMRALFDQCVGDARAVADPLQDYEAFVDVLWEQVAAAFSLVRRDWPADVPKPWPAQLDEQRGLAEALLEGRVGPEDLPR